MCIRDRDKAVDQKIRCEVGHERFSLEVSRSVCKGACNAVAPLQRSSRSTLWTLGSVRGCNRSCAVDRMVGGQDHAEEGAARATDRDSDEGADSACINETAFRAGRRADAGASGCAGHKPNQGMLAALGRGGSRDAHDVFALQRDIGTVLFECEQFIGDGDKFSAVVFQAGFEHFYPLADFQAIEAGPRTLLRLGGERTGKSEKKHKNQYRSSDGLLLVFGSHRLR